MNNYRENCGICHKLVCEHTKAELKSKLSINKPLVEQMFNRPIDWDKTTWTKEERGDMSKTKPEEDYSHPLDVDLNIRQMDLHAKRVADTLYKDRFDNGILRQSGALATSIREVLFARQRYRKERNELRIKLDLAKEAIKLVLDNDKDLRLNSKGLIIDDEPNSYGKTWNDILNALENAIKDI